MITRHNLADQLREYQLRSKHDWASASFFSSSSSNASHFTSRARRGRLVVSRVKSRYYKSYYICVVVSLVLWVDIVIFVIWELVILAFLVFSGVSLYFKHIRLAFILICATFLLLLCMKVTKQIRLTRKKKRRMLLPLSM